MTDPAGLENPLGIEAVQWSAGTGSDLLVRVAGRGGQGPPVGPVPPVLVIDTEHRRYRFPALSEPPSVRGGPGVWQVGFTVPASLAPYLAGPLTLMLGSVSIALPPAAADPGEPISLAAVRAIADPAVLSDRSERRAEDGEHEAWRRAADTNGAGAEAQALRDALELELGEASRESERLQRELVLAERKRRQAEQLAHSEKAMRLDLGRDHAARIHRHQEEARAVLTLLEAAQAHALGLEREIEQLRRSAEEEREPPLTSLLPARIDHPGPGAYRRSRTLATEMAIATSTPPAPNRPVLAASGEPPGLDLELAMQNIPARGPRSRARGGGRSTSASSGTGPALAPIVEARLAGALLHLAVERREGSELFPDARDPVATQTEYVTDAIEAIARQLEAVRAVVTLLPPAAAEALERATQPTTPPRAADDGPSPEPAGAVAPDRLAAALYRLREQSPMPRSGPAVPEAPGAAPAGVPARPSPGVLARPSVGAGDPGGRDAPRPETSRWLLRALKRMLREDPAVVGALITRLVPAQRLVLTGPIRYDIALGGAGCLAVSVGEDGLNLEILTEPRELEEVDFRIEGDLTALARLLLYGRLRRRLSRRVARVRGDRHALAALDRLIREPHGLSELYGGGLRLDPGPTLLLIAHMIDPAWTSGERFTVGYESPAGGNRVYLSVRDGAPLHTSSLPPLGPVATTIRCPEEQLLAVLGRGSASEVVVLGAAAPVTLLRDWIARAQRDS